jgi:hypothetical protein
MNWFSLQHFFYTVKPMVPRRVQLFLRRHIAKSKRKKNETIWPIDPNSAKSPKGWMGWPDGKQFALVLSHDVDSRKGYDKVLELADIEEQLGFRSQFNFVPERYGGIEIGLLNKLKSRGFGIGVHGLKHDGKLFSSKKVFDKRAPLINEYLTHWGTKGFTAPSMIRNHGWMQELAIEYSVSTFDTDPFEPQPKGAGTIFPYWVHSGLPNKGFLELPYTLAQDFTLFILLCEKSIDLWKWKLDWISTKGGMALLNSHPDYMNFDGGICKEEEYPASFYISFLKYAQSAYANQYWHALPSQVHAILGNVFMNIKNKSI